MLENVRLRRVREVSSFRHLAAAAWDEPRDPSMHGTLEVDATAALAYLAELQARGQRATPTHLVGRALAIALGERPDLNVIVRRGRFYQRREVDIFFQVALAADCDDSGRCDLSGLVVRGADRKSTAEIAHELDDRLGAVRADTDPEMSPLRRRMSRISPSLLRPLHAVLDVLQYRFNLKLPGLPRDPFGSAMVTSIGMFGIRWAYAPLFPPAHCPLVIVVGAVTQRPWVVEGEGGPRVEPRPVLPLHATFDHRVLDGVQAARLADRIAELLAAPQRLDGEWQEA